MQSEMHNGEMTTKIARCALLADRHHGLTEGVRGLLETLFHTVVMVADETSLAETAARLQPEVAVVDLSLARENSLHWLKQLHQHCPALKLIVLSVHDEPTVRQAALAAGAHAFVLKRAIATDLLPAVEAVLGDAVQSCESAKAHSK
jgi:DNA-binding NarL/FixJ family response regulator